MNREITNEEMEDHAIFDCIDCNRLLTKLYQHTLQSKCKHKLEKLNDGVKGCRKCMVVIKK